MKDHSSHFLDRFEELGLSRNEASVYLALLTNNPVTGYKLAKDSGILRPIVYEMLTRLVEKGGVKVIKDSPELYSPISPEIFLATLEKRFTDARSSLIKDLSDLTTKQEDDNNDFWNISGNEAIFTNMIDISSKAKDSIFFCINHDSHSVFLKDIFSKKVASGVKVIGFSYRDIHLPGTEIYSFKIDSNTTAKEISDHRILIVIDNKYSIIADMDTAKACFSMNPAQAETVHQFIRMKITFHRLIHVIPLSKMSLYLFDEDKLFIEKFGTKLL